MGGISLYRNILCMTAVVMALFMGTALAAPRAMTVDDAVIAGIAPGSDLSYVRSIYGEPDGEKTKRTGNYPTHLVDYYGEGFVITYDIFGGAQNPLIQSIESTNVALVMPSGIHVGMKIAEVQQIFSDIQEPFRRDEKINQYTSPRFYVEVSDEKKGIRTVVFDVDKKGVIQKIFIYDKYGID